MMTTLRYTQLTLMHIVALDANAILFLIFNLTISLLNLCHSVDLELTIISSINAHWIYHESNFHA